MFLFLPKYVLKNMKCFFLQKSLHFTLIFNYFSYKKSVCCRNRHIAVLYKKILNVIHLYSLFEGFQI